MTFMYPEQPTDAERKAMKKLFESIILTLPCEVCRDHFKKAVDSGLESALASQTTLSTWLVEVHNQVNERLGKPKMAYEKVKAQYATGASSCPAPSEKKNNAAAAAPTSPALEKWLWLGLGIIVLIVLWCAWKSKTRPWPALQ